MHVIKAYRMPLRVRKSSHRPSWWAVCGVYVIPICGHVSRRIHIYTLRFRFWNSILVRVVTKISVYVGAYVRTWIDASVRRCGWVHVCVRAAVRVCVRQRVYACAGAWVGACIVFNSSYLVISQRQMKSNTGIAIFEIILYFDIKRWQKCVYKHSFASLWPIVLFA